VCAEEAINTGIGTDPADQALAAEQIIHYANFREREMNADRLFLFGRCRSL